MLAEFGDNVDGAIRALNELQLSAPGTSKQHEEQAQQRQGILGPPPAPTPPETAAAPELKAEEPRSADQWIDLLVEQMSAATDVADAKTRASGVLRAFEQAVLQHANAGRSAEADRENAVLKRAVAIQNARIQELQVKEAENADLKASMEAAKARIQALEMQNYSLQVHLKQAADSRDMAFCAAPKNPDVF